MSLGKETALIFVLDRKYVRPLKVLLYSLEQHSSLLGCPIEIITDDPRVAADPFVSNIATSVQVMAEDELARFRTIKGDRIREKFRTSFAPKYTFLKFSVFLERGYDRHIFIDADMLCLRQLDEELITQDYDFKAMIEVAPEKYPIRDESRSNFDYYKTLESVKSIMNAREVDLTKVINSGFMVLQGKAISDQVFKSAIDIASTEMFRQEQPATTEVVKRIEGVRFLEMPIWYNARRRVIECLGVDFFEEYKKDICLLHYTPGKPWSLGSRPADFLDDLWLEWEARSTEWVKKVASGAIIGWTRGRARHT
jgi:lipopolysaccharide biosynthesis glycosyltransferase